MHRRGLPSGAFLGEMVGGHKKLKSYETPFYERIIRTFVKIVDTVEKECVKKFCIKFCKYVLFFSRKWSFLVNCENIH